MLPEIIIISLISILVILIKNKKINFSNLNFDVKGYPLILIAAAIEIAAEFLFKNYSSNNLLKILSMHWLIYLAIFAITLLNIKKPYMKLFFIGTLLNFIAIVSNDFKMPVLVSEVLSNTETKRLYLESGKDLIHSLLNQDTNFKILCDIITLAPPYPFPKTISIGDVLLLAGVFVAWQESVKAKT